MGEKMLRLTAKYADFWNQDRKNDLEEVKQLQARVDAVCREVGRDPATLGRVIGIQIDLPDPGRRRSPSPVHPRSLLKSSGTTRRPALIIW
ncbi:MAG: hypothetical protein C4346_08655 [Chloroflexota bacterium]